jgi:AraC-like DNA-binding protein
MTVLIRTDPGLSAAERFAFWHEMIGQAWVPMEPFTEHEAGFWGQIRCADLGAVKVGLMTATPFGVRRGRKLINQSDRELLKVAMPLRGPGGAAVVQDERQALLGLGDFVVYDTSRPYVVRPRPAGTVGPVHVLTLLFPRALLPLPPHQIERLTAVPMAAHRGIGALTSRLLAQVAAELDHLTPTEGARLATAALEVLAARLAHELGSDHQVPPESHQRALLARIHAFIQDHLGDPDLSPGIVAAAHHISLRYLYKLFEERDETVAGWIRARRLEACRRDLADPALASRPVAAIAARWGFRNPASFSQVFKAAHGLPPQGYRQLARGGDQTVHGS